MKYEINKIKIGKKIKDIRIELGYSVEEFAKKVNVSKGTISQYENGKMVPRQNVISTILKISGKKDITCDTFLYGKPLEYLEEIFSEILFELSYYSEEKEDFKILLSKLEKLLKNGELEYGKEEKIIEEILKINKEFSTYLDLSRVSKYLDLRVEYGLDRIKYKIEEDNLFRTKLLPELNTIFYQIGNKSDFINMLLLFSSSLLNYETNKKYSKQMVENNKSYLEKLFEDYILDHKETENFDDFKTSIPLASQSFELFLLSLEELTGVPVEIIEKYIKLKHNN